MLVFARGFSIQAASTSNDHLQLMLDWVKSSTCNWLENRWTSDGHYGFALFL